MFRSSTVGVERIFAKRHNYLKSHVIAGEVSEMHDFDTVVVLKPFGRVLKILKSSRSCEDKAALSPEKLALEQTKSITNFPVVILLSCWVSHCVRWSLDFDSVRYGQVRHRGQ